VIGRTSLFLADGPDWRWQRRAVAPIFRHEMLLSFVPTMAVIAERQAERWRAKPLEEPVELAAAMTRTTSPSSQLVRRDIALSESHSKPSSGPRRVDVC
jgi:cytochrome P450